MASIDQTAGEAQKIQDYYGQHLSQNPDVTAIGFKIKEPKLSMHTIQQKFAVTQSEQLF